jgi:hypothetical protein
VIQAGRDPAVIKGDMATDMQPGPNPRADPLATALRGAFGQPCDQALPQDFLAMLVALDRTKRGVR